MLQHPDFNAGAPYGFILDSPADVDPAITVQRTAHSDALGRPVDVTYIRFTVLCSDKAYNPNGQRRTQTRAEDYAALISILTKHSGIYVFTPLGIYYDYYTILNVTLEKQYPDRDVIKVYLSSMSTAFLPADPARYANSAWVDLTTYTGSMTWSNSYWREV